jgi:hypothetical protein
MAFTIGIIVGYIIHANFDDISSYIRDLITKTKLK